jgi:hypothetical protein
MPEQYQQLVQQLQKAHGSPHPPHWAVALLLHPSGVSLESLVPSVQPEEPEVDAERALTVFDLQEPGWVPTWFPKSDPEQQPLGPQQRLDLFDRELARHGQPDWPPSGSPSSMQRSVARSLLRMLYVLESLGTHTPARS